QRAYARHHHRCVLPENGGRNGFRRYCQTTRGEQYRSGDFDCGNCLQSGMAEAAQVVLKPWIALTPGQQVVANLFEIHFRSFWLPDCNQPSRLYEPAALSSTKNVRYQTGRTSTYLGDVLLPAVRALRLLHRETRVAGDVFEQVRY